MSKSVSRKSAHFEQREQNRELSNTTGSSETSNESAYETEVESDLITRRLLEQPLSDFEQILKTASNLKAPRKEEKKSTSKIIMQILGSDKNVKRPVSYEMEMDYIDEGASDESSPKRQNAPTRGNPVQFVPEIGQGDYRETQKYLELECGGRGIQKNVSCDESEQMRFMSSSQNLKDTETILSPEANGMFTSLKKPPVENGLVQRNPVLKYDTYVKPLLDTGLDWIGPQWFWCDIKGA
ncbi:unnamed protein product [Caenorhabditis bovis]|uniref:Uncharacterized protein n=1 Tax=Caenorhabditis bovis TaxID=2654633 RepID=A0A8S1EV16_9PELO|nr:unnamed protein product [Caenorhabditis bovis]